MSAPSTRTILLNAPLRALLDGATAKLTLATLERDTILRTVVASQAITNAASWTLTDAGLVVSLAETMP